jgi:hypothetical protein
VKKPRLAKQWWWCIPLILALGRQRQGGREAGRQRGREAEREAERQRDRVRWISEFEASLVYRVSSRTARTTQRNHV